MTRVSPRAWQRAFAAAAAAWLLALLFSTRAAGAGAAGVSAYAFTAIVYAIGGVICHQRPERSFHFWGGQFPVCARCAGIYVGALIGAFAAMGPRPAPATMTSEADPPVAAPDTTHLARLLLAAAAVPSGLTLAYEWASGHVPGNGIRAAAGLPLGLAVAWLVARVR